MASALYPKKTQKAAVLYAFLQKQFILLLYFCGYILASTLTESQWTDFSSFTFIKTAHDMQVTVLAVGAF